MKKWKAKTLTFIVTLGTCWILFHTLIPTISDPLEILDKKVIEEMHSLASSQLNLKSIQTELKQMNWRHAKNEYWTELIANEDDKSWILIATLVPEKPQQPAHQFVIKKNDTNVYSLNKIGTEPIK